MFILRPKNMEKIQFIKDLFMRHKFVIGAAVFSFVLGYIICLFFNGSYSRILKSELQNYESGTWLVKVNGDPIGKNYLDKRVALYKEYIDSPITKSDPLLRDKMLRKLIDNRIVLTAASRSRIFDSARGRDYLWIFLEEAMVNYYLDSLIRVKRGSGITMTDSEIEDFYSKNKEMFDKKNYSAKDAISLIKSELGNLNNKVSREYAVLARRVELGKMKKGIKININRDMLAGEIKPKVEKKEESEKLKADEKQKKGK